MFLKTYIAVLFTAFTEGACNNTNAIFFIKDFATKQNFPTQITCFLCWNSEEKVQLLKTLHAYNFQASIMNLKVNKVFYPQPEEHQLLVLDLNCVGYVEILKRAHNLELFREPFRWLLLNPLQSEVSFDLFFGIDSKLYIANGIGDGSFRVKTIYKIHESQDEFLESNVGFWTRNSSFQYFNHIVVGRHRCDLRGLKFDISIVLIHNDSINHLDDYKHLNKDALSKLNYVLARYLMTTINATPNFIYANTWGYKVEGSDNYTGMIGHLQRKQALLGGTSMYMTVDRIPIVDYISATVPTKIVFMFRSPPLSYVHNVFTLPFNTWVWCCIFLTLALIAIVMLTIVKWEWSNVTLRNNQLNDVHILQPKLTDVLLLEVGAVCQQGSEAEPKSGAGRIATIFIFITIMFLYTSYTACIVSLFQSTTDSIKTVGDLLNSRIKLGVENAPYSYHYFAVETEPTRKALFETKIIPKGTQKNFMSVKEGIRRMRDEFFAFHVEYGPGYKVISDIFEEHQKCGLQQIDVWGQIYPWVAAQKNSTYKELLKLGYRKLKEYGLQIREFRLFYTQKPSCTNAGNTFKSIGLVDSYFAFMLFGIGTGIALVMLLVEIQCKKYQKKINLKQFNGNIEKAYLD